MKWGQQELNLNQFSRLIFLSKIFPKANITYSLDFYSWWRVSPSMELTDVGVLLLYAVCWVTLLSYQIPKFMTVTDLTITPVWLRGTNSWVFCIVFGHPQIIFRWASNYIHRYLSRRCHHTILWKCFLILIMQQTRIRKKCFMSSFVVPQHSTHSYLVEK